MLGGVGLGRTDQVVPSECSIRGVSPVVVSCPPTESKCLAWTGDARQSAIGRSGSAGDGRRHRSTGEQSAASRAKERNSTTEESDRRRIVEILPTSSAQ